MHPAIPRRSSTRWSWLGTAAALACGAPSLLANGSPSADSPRPEGENPAAQPVAVEAPLATAPEGGPQPGAEEDKKGYATGWAYEPGEGMRWSTADGEVQVQFGGRIQNDWAFHNAADNIEGAFNGDGGSFVDGTEFRRARLRAEGTLYGKVGFKAEYDFAETADPVTDLYMSLNDLFGTMDAQVGHFKEPQGLERLTSNSYITFVERSLPDALAPARNTGGQLADTIGANNINWALGVFRTTDEFGDDTEAAGTAEKDGQYNITGRVAGTPLYDEEAARVVHLGASYSYRKTEGVTSFSTRPEDHQAPRVIDTGDIAAEKFWTAGLEGAVVLNQVSVQSEYLLTRVDDDLGEEPDFWGFYVMASYFLTGEHRPYRPKDGTFGRVKPNNNWGQGGGGAWELAARYSMLDLTDESIEGGDLQDVTAGANWYLNPNARIMFNFVYGDLDGFDGEGGEVDGPIRAFLVRFQVDF